MGRLLPTECHHGVTIDWGDFGPCQGYCEQNHPEDLDDCPDYEHCAECAAGDAPWRDHYTRAIRAALTRFGFPTPDEITVDDARFVMEQTLDPTPADQEAE